MKYFAFLSWNRAAALLLAGLGLLVEHAQASTLKTWAGAGADALWSTAANWSPSGAPVSGDNLVFNVGAPRALNTNDLVGLSVGSVTFHGGPSGFQIYGNTLFITGTQGIGATGNGSHVLRLNLSVSTAVTSDPQLWPLNQSAGGQFNFYGNIQLGIRDLTVTNNANVTFWGVLQGSGNLTNHGTGAFTLAGNAANTFTGRLAVRDNPNVVLSKTTGVAVPGDLVVTGGGVVRLLGDDQIEGDVTLLDGSTLHLDGHQDAIGALQLKRSSVQTGVGQLTLGGDVTVSAAEVSTISGRVSLGANSPVLNVADADGRLEISASLSGVHTGVGFTKTGPGFLRLRGTNTYAGVTRLYGGGTALTSDGALGTSLGGTVIGTNVFVQIEDVNVDDDFTVSSGANLSEILTLGTVALNGGLALNAGVEINVSSGEVNLNGVISGSGSLFFNRSRGSGDVRINGPAANTFTSAARIHAGLLVLNKTAGPALPGGLIAGLTQVSNDIVVRCALDNQINGDVMLFKNVTLNLQDNSDTIGGLALENANVVTGAGLLTLGGDITVTSGGTGSGTVATSEVSGRLSLGSSSREIDITAPGLLRMRAAVSGAHTGVGFTRVGDGSLSLLGTNTYAGVTRLQDGLTTLRTPQALGSTLNGTVLEGTAELHVQDAAIGSEALTVDADLHGGSVVGYGTASWEGSITFNSDGHLGCVTPGEFNLNGPLSGPGNVLLNRNFAGDLRFNGAGANTVAGTITLSKGRLILNKSPGVNAVSGPLVVGRAAMTNDATVRLAQDDQIAGAVTLWPGAVLHLNDRAETLPALTLQAADIFTGTGTLTLAGGVTNLTSDGFGPSRVFGRLALGAAQRSFNCGQGVLSLFCEVSGSSAGTMEKLGPGVLRLETNNTFNGAVRIYDGTVTAQTSGALGSTQNGVFVGTNATLSMGSDSSGGNIAVGDEAVTLQGDDSPGGEAFLTIDEKVSWNGPLIVNRAGVLNVPTAVDHLSMQGRVSGSGALRIMSSISRGTVVLAGTNDNVISGPLTLLGGTLVLSNTRPGAVVIPGVLQVNQPASTNVSTLRWERNFQFGPNSSLILEDNAAANLNDHRESLALLDLRAPVAVNTGASGQLAVPGQLLVVANLGSPARINGELNLPSGTTLCDVSTNSVLDLAGAVTGSGHFRKLGSGVLTLLASNSFTGDLTVSNGFVFAGHAAALGASIGHTYVLNRGTLELWGGRTFAERIHVSGSGQSSFGALYSGGGSNHLTQPLDLTTDALVTVDAAGDVLNLGGGTTGGRVIIKGRAGILELSGSAAGGITGLYLNEGTVRVSTPNQIADHAHVNVSSNTTLRLVGTGGSETIGSLAGSGTVQLGGNRLILGGNGNDTLFSGAIMGTAAGDAGLTKLGSGEFTITANNSYPGDTLVTDGRLTVHGDQRQSRVVVSGSGRLGGTGRVGHVNLNVGGALAPGASPGRLTVSNLVCAANTTLRMELEGPTVVTQYDQVDVNGQFNPNNSCELVVALNGYEPPEGTIFNLVRNDGAEAVLNPFKDLPEGATFTVDNTSFRISYLGGTGNDVTLTVTELPSINNPRLRIAAVGDQVQVRWPTNAVGFTLERTGEFPSTNWVTTLNNIVVDGRFFVHTNAANASARYWRLRKP